jgi:hypothetical protein
LGDILTVEDPESMSIVPEFNLETDKPYPEENL